MYIHVFNRESPCINYCLLYFIKHIPPFLFKLNLFVDFIQLQAQYHWVKKVVSHHGKLYGNHMETSSLHHVSQWFP